MIDVGESIARHVRPTLRTCLRGMLLAVTAVAGLPLFVASLVCVLLLPAGLGVVLAPKSLLAVRRQASLQRRWALEWSGVTIATPYRPRSAKPTNRLFLVFRRCGWVLGDPATWRDLLWTLVDVPVSVVLGLLPAFLVGVGAWTLGDDILLLAGWGAFGAAWFPGAGAPPEHVAARRHRGAVAAENARRRRIVAAGTDQERDGRAGRPARRVALGRGGRVRRQNCAGSNATCTTERRPGWSPSA